MSLTTVEQSMLHGLEFGPVFTFRDWKDARSAHLPVTAAGVYSIWRGGELIYVGMSGRGMTAEDVARHTTAGRRKGLAKRLASHAKGRRSGDQFCVYVADRIVLPALSPDDIAGIGTGKVSLDLLVRDVIHAEFGYRFVIVEDSDAALRLEHAARSGQLSAGKPLLNPVRQRGD